MEQYRAETGDGTVTVFVSTASPYKFCASVLPAIGEEPQATAWSFWSSSTRSPA